MNRWRARTMAAVAIAATMVLLGGCAVGTTESKLVVYEEAADELAEQIIAFIPVELAAPPALPRAEVRDGGPGTDAPTDAVWWQFELEVQLAAVQGASTDAAAAIAQGLEADGWDMRHVRDTEQGLRVADGFRKSIDDESWYVEITHVRYPDPGGQHIEVIVVSPATVRGDPS